jgi:hypothetical protein
LGSLLQQGVLLLFGDDEEMRPGDGIENAPGYLAPLAV